MPFVLDRLDKKWTGPGGRSPLKRRPSEYVRDCAIYFSAEPEESALPLVIERLGAEHLFVASDFPHELSDDGFLSTSTSGASGPTCPTRCWSRS